MVSMVNLYHCTAEDYDLFVSSVRSSSGYHGLLEIQRSSSTHFFKFFRFESESESERTQHVLYF